MSADKSFGQLQKQFRSDLLVFLNADPTAVKARGKHMITLTDIAINMENRLRAGGATDRDLRNALACFVAGAQSALVVLAQDVEPRDVEQQINALDAG